MFWGRVWLRHSKQLHKKYRFLDLFKTGLKSELINRFTHSHVLDAIIKLVSNKKISLSQELAIDINSELNRYLRILNACAVIGPAAGLLGTVLGLIRAFESMTQSIDMTLIANGISTAMITTFAGLLVAMVSLTAGHFFGGMADNISSKMEGIIDENRNI